MVTTLVSVTPDVHRDKVTVAQDADRPAVTAGLPLAWSNGPVEGQITRLPLLKRQGSGRAGFALLRPRVLQAASVPQEVGADDQATRDVRTSWRLWACAMGTRVWRREDTPSSPSLPPPVNTPKGPTLMHQN